MSCTVFPSHRCSEPECLGLPRGISFTTTPLLPSEPEGPMIPVYLNGRTLYMYKCSIDKSNKSLFS